MLHFLFGSTGLAIFGFGAILWLVICMQMGIETSAPWFMIFSIVNIEDNTTKFYIPNNTLGFLRPYRLSKTFTRTGYGVSSQIPYYWVVAGMLSQKLVFSLPENRGSRCCSRF